MFRRQPGDRWRCPRLGLAATGPPASGCWLVICDISGSMERHARVLLRFSQALAAIGRPDGGLRLRDPAHPGGPGILMTATGIAPSIRWPLPSPTGRVEHRIGAPFREFNQRGGPPRPAQQLGRRFVSDGWERDDPALVARRDPRGSSAAVTASSGSRRSPPRRAISRWPAGSAAMPFVETFVPAGTLAWPAWSGWASALGRPRPGARRSEGRVGSVGRGHVDSAGHAPLVGSDRPDVHEVATVRAAGDGSSGAAARPLDGRARPDDRCGTVRA